MNLDSIIKAWSDKQSSRVIIAKPGKVPQSLRDAIIKGIGAMPTPMMISHAMRRCGYTKQDDKRPGWVSPPSDAREGLLSSFNGLKCPSCGTITRDNRPDGYRFRCVDCGYTETAEQSLARLRTPEQ